MISDKYPKLLGVNYESMVDGEGVRAVFFFSGCPHHCFGCHNPDSWDFEAGQDVTEEAISHFAEELIKRPFLSGITFSGGEPLLFPKKVWNFYWSLCNYAETLLPLWIYTGYAWEELQRKITQGDESLKALLVHVSVLVDGRFEIKKADKRLLFRGSSNQRLIDVTESLTRKEVILYEPDQL